MKGISITISLQKIPNCLLFSVNASRLIETVTMKAIRIDHIYGTVVIQSLYCESCNQRAFIVEGRLTCCNREVSSTDAEKIKVEVDVIGKKRKLPPWWMREAILEEQKNCCFYCGEEFGTWFNCGGQVRRVKLNWDHVIPFSYDGNNYEFVASCSICNQVKSNNHFQSLKEAKQFVRLKRGL